MPEDVTTNVETTTSAEQTAAQQTTASAQEPAVEPTREVNNTPTVPSREDAAVNGQPQVAPEVPQEKEEQYVPRFQEENDKLINFESEIRGAVNQSRANPAAPNIPDVRDLQLAQLGSQLARLEEEQKWNDVFSKHPELKKDKELDDLVYSAYVTKRQSDPKVTPTQVADQVFKSLGKLKTSAAKEAYTKAEDDLATKGAASQTPARRSESTGSDDQMSKNMQKYKETGDQRFLIDSVKY